MEGSSLIVSAVEEIADSVHRITLADPDGRPLASWEPGAHVDLHLGGTVTRQYSLCGDVDDAGSWTIAVRLVPDGGGGSRLAHALSPGDSVAVSDPRNRFPLESAAAYLFVAGGIGITPILPMVRAARKSDVEHRLFYAGRDRASMPFLEELQPHGHTTVWTDDVDGIPDVATVVAEAAPGTVVYCCGPGPMIDAVLTAAAARGLECRFEPFASGPVDTEEADEAFAVQLATSGLTVDVPAGVSILDALLEAGVDIDYSCHEGTCGTCETMVCDGVPDHRDPMWSVGDGPTDSMLICVSRSRTPTLVLDL